MEKKKRRSKNEIKAQNTQKEIDKLSSELETLRNQLKLKEQEIQLLQKLQELYKGAS